MRDVQDLRVQTVYSFHPRWCWRTY